MIKVSRNFIPREGYTVKGGGYMCEWLCVCVSLSVWYVYAYVHVGVPTLLYVCVYVCIISMGAVSKKCYLFDKHILAPRKLPRSFNKHSLAENPACVDMCMYTLYVCWAQVCIPGQGGLRAGMLWLGAETWPAPQPLSAHGKAHHQAMKKSRKF